MTGIELPTLASNPLFRVEEKYEMNPIESFVKPEKLAFVQEFPGAFTLEDLSKLTFDQLCKFYFSAKERVHPTVSRIIEENNLHDLVRKIGSSFWKWGFTHATWNEIADAYGDIQNFTFGINSDFEIRLDYAGYFVECGLSKMSRTFLDGSFGFLVYYKKKHVMTIGFSLISGKRILIQQVQLVHRTGNRFLYMLPENRVEFVIDLFRKNFSGYALYIVDPEGVTEKISNMYQDALRRWSEDSDRIFEVKKSISHFEANRQRIIALYRNIGKFALDRRNTVIAHKLTHFEITA